MNLFSNYLEHLGKYLQYFSKHGACVLGSTEDNFEFDTNSKTESRSEKVILLFLF